MAVFLYLLPKKGAENIAIAQKIKKEPEILTNW